MLLVGSYTLICLMIWCLFRGLVLLFRSSLDWFKQEDATVSVKRKFWSFKPPLSPRSKEFFSGCYWIKSFEWPPITRLGDNIHNHFPYWIHVQCRLGVKTAAYLYFTFEKKDQYCYLFNNIYLFIYLFRLIYFILCNIIWLRLQMKMHFGWKPLILWSLLYGCLLPTRDAFTYNSL